MAPPDADPNLGRRAAKRLAIDQFDLVALRFPAQSHDMRFAVVLLFLLAACGRPLTVEERNFLDKIHGPGLDTSKVRLIDHAPLRAYTLRIPKRPRLSCQERILPEPTTDIVSGAPAAVALFNSIWLNHSYALPNYMKGYPEQLYLLEAMFLAHEMTHVWQWQNRNKTGYHPLKAAREHQATADPYLYDLTTDKEFLDFGYEQQGAIVEEYVCCTALAPDAARTERLRKMLSKVFPIKDLPQTRVIPPWDGADFSNICS